MTKKIEKLAIVDNLCSVVFKSLPIVYLIFLIVGFVVYSQALKGQFLWDDAYQIIYTPDTYSLGNLFHLFTKGQLGIFYKPGFFAYLTIIHSLFGLNQFVFHFFQILIHVTNAFLVFLLLRKILNRQISFILSLVFIVHPMNVEAIAYISAAGDPLSFLFGLLAFHIMSRSRVGIFGLLGASGFMLFSLLSKESGIVILFLVIVYRYLFIKKSAFASILFAASSSSFYFFLRFYVAKTMFVKLDFIPIALATPWERFISIPKILFTYFSTFLVPFKLYVAQHWVVRTISLTDFFLPLLFIIVLISAIITIIFHFKSKSNEKFVKSLFFLIWIAFSTGLYLQIVPIDMTVAERWFYLPMIGVLGLIGLIIKDVPIRSHKEKVLACVMAVVIIAALAGRTIVRSRDWTSAYVLFGHDIQIAEDSFDIEMNYSYQLVKKGKYDEALPHAIKATRLAPKFTATWATLGSAYLRRADYFMAISSYKKSLQIDTTNYAAFYGLIHAYILLNDINSARYICEKAMYLYPKDPHLLLFRAIIEYESHHEKQALNFAKQSYNSYPTHLGRYLYMNLVRKQSIKSYRDYIQYN